MGVLSYFWSGILLGTEQQNLSQNIIFWDQLFQDIYTYINMCCVGRHIDKSEEICCRVSVKNSTRYSLLYLPLCSKKNIIVFLIV